VSAPADWPAELHSVLATHGVDKATHPRFKALLELVRDDSTAPTTVTDPLEGVAVHIADSLDGLTIPEIRQATRIADLGTGAGFPGIPLAIALPDAQVHLVESLAKKCAFLERALEVSETENATVACARAEDWPERELDVVTARAVAPLNILVEYAAPLLRLGGVLVAWKGKPEDAEVADGEAAAEIVGLESREPTVLEPRPGADHRRLYVYLKVRDTPSRFPRRAGMARKRPLSASI
jgi:16S rRNA (guanine527-N7)-methyltransferase